MFKEIQKFEQLSGNKLGVSISVQLGRELTEDESELAYSFVESMMKLMARNNCLQDSVYMKAIEIQKKDILALFPSLIYVKEIPNGYSPDYIEPWYIVTTHKGPITIGWRKRVIQIDWSQSEIPANAEERLFSAEDVTKGSCYIHAWGYDKAKEYINKLLS